MSGKTRRQKQFKKQQEVRALLCKNMITKPTKRFWMKTSINITSSADIFQRLKTFLKMKYGACIKDMGVHAQGIRASLETEIDVEQLNMIRTVILWSYKIVEEGDDYDPLTFDMYDKCPIGETLHSIGFCLQK
ncbi:MAG: hypothetical protein MJE68_25350 [Proteobacteria bacterium]|nr:hypothetical protein [Pseudomonadota bacterium]